MSLVSISHRLSDAVDGISFAAPVTHVYNPLVYARASHERYLERYGEGSREIVLVGMNPGPWGMAQTGVPFGDPATVRDWLGITEKVQVPPVPHARGPVRGFDSPRGEVSGQRLWGWARQRFDTPERFFARFFVTNWCPLCFLEQSGRNRTPDKLHAHEREALFPACDRALREVVEVLGARRVIGVGAFAEARARDALQGMDVEIGRILHPSPASPLANKGWAEQAERGLRGMGVEV